MDLQIDFMGAGKLLERLLGPSADMLGERMKKNLERVLDRAGQRIQEQGGEAQSVPPRVLFPLLRGASLEEDPTLQDMWSFLLANASNPGEDPPVHPRFPELLGQLDAMDAAVLQHLAGIPSRDAADPNAYTGRSELQAALEVSHVRLLTVSLDNLRSLGLVEGAPSLIETERGKGVWGVADPAAVKITELGYWLVAACSGPAVHPSESGEASDGSDEG